MFPSIRLYEAFEHVALPNDWNAFSVMETPYNSDLQQCGENGWPTITVEEDRRFRALWERFAKWIERKLWSGEWMAEGISADFGPRYAAIDTLMWEFLRLEPMADAAVGDGFRFTHLRFTATRLALVPSVVVPQSQTATLRRELTDWIRHSAEAAGTSILRDEQKAAARAAFPECVISDNMFRDSRRDAKLEEVSVQKGRPKAKVKGSEK